MVWGQDSLSVLHHLHRVGRTGRFGTLGICVSYVTAPELAALRTYLEEAQAGGRQQGTRDGVWE